MAQMLRKQVYIQKRQDGLLKWKRAHQFMLDLHVKGPLRNRPRTWTRDELYEEPSNRHGSRACSH